MLEAIKDVGTIVATFGGIWLAWRGLETWRKEVIGKRDIEIAEEILLLFYRAEENVAALRSPMVWWYEGQSRKKQQEETPEVERRRNALFGPLERLNGQMDFWVSFYASRHRGRIAFGPEVVEPFKEIDRVVREYRAAASSLYEHLFHDETALPEETKREFNSVVFQHGSDAIEQRIQASVATIETICVPKARW